MHLSLPAGAVLPASHSVALVEPSRQAWPGGHGVHSFLRASVVESPNVPGGHGTGKTVPGGQ